MKLLIFIVSLTFVRTQPSIFHNSSIDINEEKDIEVRDTFDLLEEGQRNIILSKQRNLVLVLGNTGSGKSTFLQWLFGDNEKLTAKETAEGTFIIEDGNKRIGNLTINSKTLFPELVMDKNSAYYDCPGFSDTRSTQHDVAITYFIKRVADHAKKVKLVFIVNHSSVRKGLDRIDFMKLLTHATDLVKNIEKFRNSISITATKVDNLSRENDNGRMVLISDEDVINGIAEFLAEVKGALGKDSAKVKYVQLINIFLLKNRNGNYDRIGLFRRPARSGPLSKNKVLQKGKKNIMRILNTLVYTNKTVADFGYTVSDRSKADIIYLMRNIAITVEVNFDKIGDVLLGKYRILISDVETKLNGFLSEDVVDANVNEEVEKTNKLLILGIREISGMVVKIKNLKNPRGLVEIVRSFVSNLKFDLPINNTINIISKQSEYFDFLQLVSNKTFSISLPKSWTLNWENKAQNLSIFHSEFLNYTRSIVEKITIQVDDLFSTVGRLIYDHHKEIVERMKERVHLSLNSSMENVNIIEVSKMKENLNEVIIVTSDLIQDIQKLNNLSLLCERLIKSAKNMSLNETTKIKLKKFLSFLNNKDNILMRKSWALLYKNEVIKISNLTQDFQIFTNSLINIENYRITDIIESCMLILQNYYEKLTKQINYEINSFVNGSLPFSNPFLVQKLVKELSKGYFTTTKLSTESVHLKTPIELAKKMLSFASTLNINSLNEIVANIEKYLSSLNFLLNEGFISKVV